MISVNSANLALCLLILSVAWLATEILLYMRKRKLKNARITRLASGFNSDTKSGGSLGRN